MLPSSSLRLKSRLRAFSQLRKMSRNCSNGLVVPKDDVVRFISESMKKVGATAEDALEVGEHLMTADYRGHFSHGLNRMQMYVKEIDTKLANPTAKPQIVQDFQVRAKRRFEFREIVFFSISLRALIRCEKRRTFW